MLSIEGLEDLSVLRTGPARGVASSSLADYAQKHCAKFSNVVLSLENQIIFDKATGRS